MNIIISIHAPRTGSDQVFPVASPATKHFNPRSPHGERRMAPAVTFTVSISIHAPRTGSDSTCLSLTP